MRNKISITGDIGSGKSTVAKIVSEKLNAMYFSTGAMQREIADNEKLSTLELNRQSDEKTTIDEMIDTTSFELGESEREIVFDSRMAWHFVKVSFKVRIIVSPLVGAKRIIQAGRKTERYKTLKEAIEKIEDRKHCEINRFFKKYAVDMTNDEHFDLVIDSSNKSPEEVSEEIIVHYKRWQKMAC